MKLTTCKAMLPNLNILPGSRHGTLPMMARWGERQRIWSRLPAKPCFATARQPAHPGNPCPRHSKSSRGIPFLSLLTGNEPSPVLVLVLIFPASCGICKAEKRSKYSRGILNWSVQLPSRLTGKGQSPVL